MEKAKKNFIKNMASFSMTTWITFILGFIASPIATRLFVPSELAKVSMFSTYASLLSSVCYLGLDQAFVRFYAEPPAGASQKGLFSFSLALPLAAVTGLCAVLLLFWRQLSAAVVDVPDMGVFLCLCLYSFSLVGFRFSSLLYRMEKNAVLYTIQGVVYAIFTKVAYLAVGFAGVSGKVALLSLTVLTALVTFTFIAMQRKHLSIASLKEATPPFRREMFTFALPLVPLAFLSWCNSEVSKVVLRMLLGMEAAGIYASALGLAATINIIQTGFNTYWAPYVFEHYKSDDSRRFFTVHRLMACLLTLFGLGITLLQTPVFLLLGSGYRSSVVYFPFLFLSPICYCLGETTGMGINIAKKTYWTTAIYLVSALANIGFCFLLIPLMGMAGAALATAITAIVTLLLRTYLGERHYRAIEDWRYLGFTIGLMLVASFGNLWLTGVAKYALIVGLLALACVLFRREIVTLWTTARQIVKEGRSLLRRKKEEPHDEANADDR